MQILAPLYAFKLVKNITANFMHFHDNLWSLA